MFSIDWGPADVPPHTCVHACIHNNATHTGGYDAAVRENVEYLAELQQQAQALGLLPPGGGEPLVSFRPSISDAERAQLLQDALCVLYTPDREHFGIVPLEVRKAGGRRVCVPMPNKPTAEQLSHSSSSNKKNTHHQAMYAGSPVVAVASGGPLETVQDGQTGFLRPGTASGFADAIARMVRDPGLKEPMGRAGHAHVRGRFGLDAFSATLEAAVRQTVEAGAVVGAGTVGWVVVVLLLLAVIVVAALGTSSGGLKLVV